MPPGGTDDRGTFALPDLKPPRLLTITPTDGALRQSLWLDGWTLNFDESLDPAALASSNFTLRTRQTRTSRSPFNL
jgi:hypothetical protein